MKFTISKAIFPMALLCLKWAAAVPQWHNASDGSSYLIELEAKHNWFKAWDECSRQDLQLVVIDSLAKNEAIIEMLTNLNETAPNLWLGAHDDLITTPAQGSWSWFSTGQKLSYDNWATGKPSTVANNCMHTLDGNALYQWSDALCSQLFGYICEDNHFLTSYKQTLNDKRATVEQKNKALADYYAMQQSHINVLNLKADFEIEALNFNMKKDIEQLQTGNNMKIKEMNEERKKTIESLEQKFRQELEQNQEDVKEILIY